MITIVGLVGYSGRMGQSIAEIIKASPSACLAGGITRSMMPTVTTDGDKPLILTSDAEELFPQCDVIIDFSHASATAGYARIAAKCGKPFLSGVTGVSEADINILKDVSKTIPVLYTTNTSLSLVVVRHMVRLGAKMLKDHDYDISIFDKHHRNKKDSPSGTALSLGNEVLKGNEGSHPPSYASARVGSIVGEHDILFAGVGEVINLQHTVTDRRVFARGAVEAALWLAPQKSGFYSMDNVLTIE